MIIQIRSWLYIGDNTGCQELQDAGCIHIYRDDHPEYDCDFVEHAGDIRLNYQDGHEIPIQELRRLSLSIFSFIEDYGKVFIHCHTGDTRSPTIALLALSLIESRHPIDVMPDIYMPMWKKSLFPNICMQPLKDIVMWYESR